MPYTEQCPRSINGCPWRGPQDAVTDHVDQACKYRKVQCECGLSVLAWMMKAHKASICKFKNYSSDPKSSLFRHNFLSRSKSSSSRTFSSKDLRKGTKVKKSASEPNTSLQRMRKARGSRRRGRSRGSSRRSRKGKSKSKSKKKKKKKSAGGHGAQQSSGASVDFADSKYDTDEENGDDNGTGQGDTGQGGADAAAGAGAAAGGAGATAGAGNNDNNAEEEEEEEDETDAVSSPESVATDPAGFTSPTKPLAARAKELTAGDDQEQDLMESRSLPPPTRVRNPYSSGKYVYVPGSTTLSTDTYALTVVNTDDQDAPADFQLPKSSAKRRAKSSKPRKKRGVHSGRSDVWHHHKGDCVIS